MPSINLNRYHRINTVYDQLGSYFQIFLNKDLEIFCSPDISNFLHIAAWLCNVAENIIN